MITGSILTWLFIALPSRAIWPNSWTDMRIFASLGGMALELRCAYRAETGAGLPEVQLVAAAPGWLWENPESEVPMTTLNALLPR